MYGHFLSEEWTCRGLALPSSDRSRELCNLWFVSPLQYQTFPTFLTVSCFKADSPPFPQCHDEIRPRLRHERDWCLQLNSGVLRPSGALHSQGSWDVPIAFNTVGLYQTVWCLVWTISTKILSCYYVQVLFIATATSWGLPPLSIKGKEELRTGAGKAQRSSTPPFPLCSSWPDKSFQGVHASIFLFYANWECLFMVAMGDSTALEVWYK